MSPFILLLVLIATVSAQFGGNSISCGFTCSRQTSFSVSIDGQFTTARCSDNNADPIVRCSGCCAARALAAGLDTTHASGFASINGRDCICCINNLSCGGGGMGPIPTFNRP